MNDIPVGVAMVLGLAILAAIGVALYLALNRKRY
jgi:hypothetical protein